MHLRTIFYTCLWASAYLGMALCSHPANARADELALEAQPHALSKEEDIEMVDQRRLQEIQSRFPNQKVTRLVHPGVATVGDYYYELTDDRAQIVIKVPKAAEKPITYAVKGDLLVSLRPGKTRVDLEAKLRTYTPHFVIAKEVSKRGVYLLHTEMVDSSNPFVAAETLEDKDLFLSVEVNQIIFMMGNQHGITIPREQWSLDYSGLELADADYNVDVDGIEILSRLKFWRGVPLQEVVVAVIDSGIATGHPGLKNKLWVNTKEVAGNGKDDDKNGKVDDIHGWNFLSNTNDIEDNNSHGTHVAGIIAAEQYKPGVMTGLAPKAKIMVLKIADQKMINLDAGIAAIDYAVENGAKVINMSWVTSILSNALDDAIRYTADHDVFTVAAAGNAEPGKAPEDISLPGKEKYPCLMQVSVCVVATDQKGGVAAYSNYNSNPWSLRLFAAPGSEIFSTVPNGYKNLSGTSMATPHVAAAAAIIRGVHPEFSRDDVYRQLFENSNNVPSPSRFYNTKRLNIYRAVTAPKSLGSDDKDSYCNKVIEREPRSRRGPFANSQEPGIDGNSEATAYAICSARQLLAIKSQLIDKYFTIKQNLDWNELHEAERERIGTVEKPFQGILSGNGYALQNYRYDIGLNDTGLFAKIGYKGVVKNFRMTNVYLKARDDVGALTGINEGEISDVQVEGVVKGRNNVGGIVGVVQIAAGGADHSGQIRNVFFEGKVIGESNVGGIAGIMVNNASLDLGFAKGLIAATVPGTSTAGGVVGLAGFGAEIRRSHAITRVSSDGQAGGIVGLLRCGASVVNSYSGSMTVEAPIAGGLVGLLENAVLKDTYSLSFAVGAGNVGGLVGRNADNSEGRTPETIACTETTSKTPSSVTRSFYLLDQNYPGAGGEGKSLAELRMAATFTGWEFGQSWGMQFDESPSLTLLPRTLNSLY